MTIESLLIAVIFCFSILPLIAVVFRVQAQRKQILGALVALWLVIPAAIVATAIYGRHAEVNLEHQITDRPIQVASDGYVGSRTCRTCHPHQHSTWYDSYHRTMTQLATPESVIGQFNNVSLPAGDVEFQLDQKDESFWVKMIVSMDAERPGTRATLERPIVMTTGSHHMQAYWFSFPDHTRHLGMLPFMFLKEEQRWVPRNAAFLIPPRDTPPNEQGRWNEECIQCHATHGRLRPVSISDKGNYDVSQVDTQVAEFGISCEACHGPGQRHVNHNRDPLRRYRTHVSAATDDTIVNPAKLSHDRSSQVCGQCHGIHIDYDDPDAIHQAAMYGNPFRPGEDLSKSPVRYLARCGLQSPTTIEGDVPSAISDVEAVTFENSFWLDGMVRVSGREYNGLIESPCFQRGELSCLSCHQLHQSLEDPRPRKEWANDQLHLEMRRHRACIQCHQQYQEPDAIAAHTHHPVESSGSNCYNCHMSYTTYGLLKAIRSHTIDVPDVATSIQTGRPHACNQCHLDQTLGWTARHLSDWYGIDEPELNEEQRSVAASVLLTLQGDAGQRALMAWSFGWKNAQQASGTSWMAPYLALLVTDRYDAVRFIANRSLRTLPGFEDYDGDFLASPDERLQQRQMVEKMWHSRSDGSLGAKPEVLIENTGQIEHTTMQRLLEQRNDPDIVLSE